MKLLLASLLLVFTVQSLPRFSRGLDDPVEFVMDLDDFGDGYEEIWNPDNDDYDGYLNGDSNEEVPADHFGDNENDGIPFEDPSTSSNRHGGNGRRGFLDDVPEEISKEKLKELIRKEVQKVLGEKDREENMDAMREVIKKRIEMAAQAVEKSKKSTRKGFLDIEDDPRWHTGPIVLDIPQRWDEGDWKTDSKITVEKSKKSTRRGFRDILVDRSGPPPIIPQIPTVLTGIVPEFPWNRDDWKSDYYMDCFGVRIPTAPFGFRRKSAARKGFSETSLDPTDLDPPPFVPDYPIDLDEDEDLEDLESPVLHKSRRNLAFPDERFVQGWPWWMENGKPVETEGRNHAEIKDDEPVKNRKLARRGGYVRKGSWWGWLTGGFPESGDTRGKDHM